MDKYFELGGVFVMLMVMGASLIAIFKEAWGKDTQKRCRRLFAALGLSSIEIIIGIFLYKVGIFGMMGVAIGIVGLFFALFISIVRLAYIIFLNE